MRSLLKIPVCIIFIFLFSDVCGGDHWRTSPGAAEAGTGYACISRYSFWASFHNQALLASARSFSAGFNYRNSFGLKELGTRSAAVVLHAGKAGIGAVYNYFGYSDYRRQSAGLACGLKISENLAAGAQIDYFDERTYGEYNSIRQLTFETGLVFSAWENTKIGIHVFNPLPATLYRSFIPARLRFGASTSLGGSVSAMAEAEMSTGGKMILRTGVEYLTMKKISLRGGFCTENNSFSMGMGYVFDLVQLDIAFLTHEKLGVTSSASLIFKIR